MSSAKAVKVAFAPDKLVDAIKDFRGVIVDAQYGMEPFGFKGNVAIERREQMAIKIRTEAYEKDQIEWFPPSDKKLTKWAYLIEALASTGALRDVIVKGETDEERMQSFAKSLVGMEFRWLERSGLDSIAKNKKIDLLVPVEYYGKKEISPITEIKEEEVKL
jgi:hypothetical protein